MTSFYNKLKLIQSWYYLVRYLKEHNKLKEIQFLVFCEDYLSKYYKIEYKPTIHYVNDDPDDMSCCGNGSFENYAGDDYSDCPMYDYWDCERCIESMYLYLISIKRFDVIITKMNLFVSSFINNEFCGSYDTFEDYDCNWTVHMRNFITFDLIIESMNTFELSFPTSSDKDILQSDKILLNHSDHYDLTIDDNNDNKIRIFGYSDDEMQVLQKCVVLHGLLYHLSTKLNILHELFKGVDEKGMLIVNDNWRYNKTLIQHFEKMQDFSLQQILDKCTLCDDENESLKVISYAHRRVGFSHRMYNNILICLKIIKNPFPRTQFLDDICDFSTMNKTFITSNCTNSTENNENNIVYLREKLEDGHFMFDDSQKPLQFTFSNLDYCNFNTERYKVEMQMETGIELKKDKISTLFLEFLSSLEIGKVNYFLDFFSVYISTEQEIYEIRNEMLNLYSLSNTTYEDFLNSLYYYPDNGMGSL